MFLDWVLKVTVAFSHTDTCWEWEGREQRWSHSCQMNMLQKSKIEIDYKSLIASSLYETKVSPAVLINKNCHSHQWLLASRCNEGSQTVVQWMLRPRQEDCWGAGRMQSNKVIKQTDWPQIAEVRMKGMNSESRGLYLPIQRMLNALIPDLWCSDCLLSLLQTCM